MKHALRLLCALVAFGLLLTVVAGPAAAAPRPVITGLSTHRGVYWGGERITIHGRNLSDVRQVRFGRAWAGSVRVTSDSTISVRTPFHEYATVHVAVVTGAGSSLPAAADAFRFVKPTMDTPIFGGLTARQERWISARMRARHPFIATARAAHGWTPAMGATALRRARSWLGLPYSWAGGNGSGPTAGVCAHNGGDLDCHVVGLDCSGLSLYAWSPYRKIAHYAATQYRRAGRFHPSIGQLMPGDLVFFSAYIPHGIGHVAVYEGRGMVVQAEQSGTRIMRSALTDVIAGSGTYRGATRPASIGRQAPAPRVTSTTAALPVQGGDVTITGSRLGGATSVSVDGRLIYTFARRTASRLVVRVPSHRAGAVSLAVSNAWGTAYRTLTYAAAPRLSTPSPAAGPTDGGNAVTLTGAYLRWVTAVTVDGARIPVTGANPLRLTMPAHAAGPVSVLAYSPFGSSNRVTYTYLAPTPTPTTSTPPPPTVSGAARR